MVLKLSGLNSASVGKFFATIDRVLNKMVCYLVLGEDDSTLEGHGDIGGDTIRSQFRISWQVLLGRRQNVE